MRFAATTGMGNYISQHNIYDFDHCISLINNGTFDEWLKMKFNPELLVNMEESATDGNITVVIKKLIPSDFGVLLSLSVSIDGEMHHGEFNELRFWDDRGDVYKCNFYFYTTDGNINLILEPPVKEGTKTLHITFRDFKSRGEDFDYEPFIPYLSNYLRCDFAFEIDLRHLGVKGCKTVRHDETLKTRFIDIPVTFRNIIIYPESFSFEMQGYEEIEDWLDQKKLHVLPIFRGDSRRLTLIGRKREASSEKKVSRIIAINRLVNGIGVFGSDRIADKFWEIRSWDMDRKRLFNIYYSRHKMTGRNFSDILSHIELMIVIYKKDDTPPFIGISHDVRPEDVAKFL